MNQKCILLKGCQASRKSTWAKDFIKKNKNYKKVNRDAIRFMLSEYDFNEENENLVQKIWKDSVGEILNSGYNLLIDEMNLSENTRNKNITIIKEFCPGIKIEIKEFPVTLEEAIARDKKRDFVIGEKVIRNTWNKYKDTLEGMLKNYIPIEIEEKKPEKDCYKVSLFTNKSNAIIVDVDGTLARKWEGRGIFDSEKAINDYPINPVTHILSIFFELRKYINGDKRTQIIICSGRQEFERQITEDWFTLHCIYYDKFFMRKTGDKRKDSIVKKEIYKEFIEPYYNVIGVFDDRPQVLRMWQNELGLFTFAVNQDVDCKNDF